MRNIYDIITEQKAIVDVNMATYDLNYTVTHFMNHQDEYYVQEGLGEGLKNAVDKVIAFINAVINKIKELIGKILGFFSKKRPAKEQLQETVNKMDTNKKPESKPDDDSAGGGNENDRFKYYKCKSGNPPKSFKEHIENSLRTVNIIRYVGLKEKAYLSKNFFGVINGTVGNFAADYNHAGDVFIKTITTKMFKGDGSIKKMPEATIAQRIQAELKEPTEPENVKVADLADVIEGYLDGYDDLSRNLPVWRDLANKNLGVLKAKLEKLKNEGKEVKEQDFANIQKVASIVSQFMAYMPSNIVKAYNTYEQIFKQVCNDAEAAYDR